MRVKTRSCHSSFSLEGSSHRHLNIYTNSSQEFRDRSSHRKKSAWADFNLTVSSEKSGSTHRRVARGCDRTRSSHPNLINRLTQHRYIQSIQTRGTSSLSPWLPFRTHSTPCVHVSDHIQDHQQEASCTTTLSHPVLPISCSVTSRLHFQKVFFPWSHFHCLSVDVIPESSAVNSSWAGR